MDACFCEEFHVAQRKPTHLLSVPVSHVAFRVMLDTLLTAPFLQAETTVEVDPEAMEKLQVSQADFLHALANDVKPVSN